MIDRRSILRAALFVAAAPVVVRASSLMKVRPILGDGVSLFATSHSVGYVTVYNSGSGYKIGDTVEISEESLTRAIAEVQKFKHGWRVVSITPGT